MAFDREKFKQLVHYVVWKAGRRDWFGATKLNKVLWFAESRAYVLTGSPITGATYIREKWGPVPKPMMPVRDELEDEGAIRVTREDSLVRVVSLRQPDVSLLSREDRQAVDWWVDHIASDHTAGTISEASHDYAWQIAAMGEEIPMFATFANRIVDEPSEQALSWGRETAARLGLS